MPLTDPEKLQIVQKRVFIKRCVESAELSTRLEQQNAGNATVRT